MRSYFCMNGGELTIVLFFVATVISGQHDEQAVCRRYNSGVATWTCKRITDCKLSSKLLGTPQEYRCGSDKRQGKICCPAKISGTQAPAALVPKATFEPKYIRTIKEKCMEYASARYQNKCIGGDLLDQVPVCSIVKDCKPPTITLIVGGEKADEKEFPHMALIGYGEELTDDTEWNCGGSLISERFILTAGHCTKTLKPARWAGLGQLDRAMYTPDSLDINVFRIVKAHLHPEYKAPYENNDIALFELQNGLKFTSYIRPLCLHTEPSIPEAAQNNATILGWGKVGAGFDESRPLLKATISFLSSSMCTRSYANESKLKNGFDTKTMICAGDRKKDTCQGDSGGPIQVSHEEECMYIQVGITSMGSDYCGDGTPAIYTRVYPYLEWIHNIVWAQKGSRTPPRTVQ